MAGVRLKDVAELAGVSIKTVSNVVRGEAHVAEPTRRRVQLAVEKLGYRPHSGARQLRTGRSGVLALAVPELLSPYFAALAAELIGAAKRRGCTMLIEETGGDPEAELAVACGLGDPLIDGVVLSPLRLDQSRLAARPSAVPLVLLGEQEYEVCADHVGVDNVAAARQATEHLLAAGHRRIGVIGHQRSPSFATADKRLDGHLLALHGARLPYDPELAPPVRHYSRAHGAEAMRRLMALEEPPTAVFCFADVLAAGAVRAAYDAGLRVPDDLAVVGFDDVEESQYAVPSLTSVGQNRAELAELAIRALLERVERPDLPQRVFTAGHQLFVRESSGG